MFKKLPSKQTNNNSALQNEWLRKGFLIERGVLVLYLGNKSSEIIPDFVKEISKEAFSHRTSLVSITIPSSVTKIGKSAFAYCKNLTSVTMSASIKIIEEFAFDECTSLSSISIPDGVTEIGYSAFGNCTSLTVIKLPNSICKISPGAFYGPLITIVCQEGSYSHRFCQENSYRYIFDYQYMAFHGALPAGIKEFPAPFPADEEKPFIFISYSHRDRDEVFHYIKPLYESGWKIWYDEGLTIGDNYDMTLEDHIRGCTVFLLFVTKSSINSNYIKEFEIPWAKTYHKPIIKCMVDKEVDIEIEETLVVASVPPSGLDVALKDVSIIKKGRYRKAKGISVAVNPADREILNTRGFAYCIYSKQSHSQARAILHDAKNYGCILYDAVECGADLERLRNCSCLIIFIDRAYLADPTLIGILTKAYQTNKDIVLYRLEEINEQCFPKELRNLTKLHWLIFNGNTTDKNKKLANHLQKRGCRDTSIIPGFNYIKTEKGIILTKYTGMDLSPNIECEYNRIPVIGIGDYAFMNCMYLRKIVIPDSVTEIGRCSFKGCHSLSSITIPYGITEIRDMAFSECTSLVSLTIPDSVTVIDSMAFFKCTNLKTITLPQSIKMIGHGAFSGCECLTTIILPSSLASIDYAAFMDFTGLRSIVIPDSVTEIANLAFCGCQNLSSIVIPDSVMRIGESAFEDCENLTIYGDVGSYAHDYAQKNNYTFTQK